DHDRARMAHLVRNLQYRRCEIHLAVGAVEMHREAAAGGHAIELLEEIDVEISAAELAIRDALEAESFLEAHHVANRIVLHGSQLRARDLAALVAIARLEQLPRPEEAADVVGAERWRVAFHAPGSLTFSMRSNSTLNGLPPTISQRRT